MSVHDELKKAVNRIAQLEQELKVSEDVREQRRDELTVLGNKYEAEKFKAESRHQTIDSLLNRIRLIESEHASNAELWESAKWNMEATIHELKTRLQIDPGGSDLIDAQQSAMENLGHVLGKINEGLKIINVRIAFIGHPKEPFWWPGGRAGGDPGRKLPDWRKEIALIHEMLLWTDHAGESRECPGCHQRRHDCICVDSAS